MLKLNRPDYDSLRRHGEETYPHECCGILLGRMDDDGTRTVTSTARCGNTRTDSAHNRYNIDPKELVRIQRDGRDRGEDIVGESCPIALGIAYAVAMRGLPEAVICFFGDGAVNQGTFHESLNMAGLWRLPLLFVCENNHYAIGTEIHRHSAVVDVFKRAAAYNIPAEKVDGMDVQKVYEAARRALDRIRSGGGPQFLECDTYRYGGHSMADPGSYPPAV